MAIYKHYDGYQAARQKTLDQSLEADLALIDALYGRDELSYGATPEEVKQEALRQLEIDWRDEVNEEATAWVTILKAGSER